MNTEGRVQLVQQYWESALRQDFAIAFGPVLPLDDTSYGLELHKLPVRVVRTVVQGSWVAGRE
jgi:hypothetical protein